MDVPPGKPLRLIVFNRPNKGNVNLSPREREKIQLTVEDAALKQVLDQVGNRPLCIIAICGPCRQGKSLMLGYMIRRLEALEQADPKLRIGWMDWKNPDKPVSGFAFRSGTQHFTEGMWTWSRPFIVKDGVEEGKEVAVLLVDTQGTNDENLTTTDMSMIVGLTLLLSSITVLNIFTILQEDIMQALNTYIEFGKHARINGGVGTNETERPFQDLTVLIRDWNFPGEHEYGDGQRFLEEKLKIKEEHNQESRQVRETIRDCFTKLNCFLLPHIGQEAIKAPNFTGCISQLDKKFAQQLNSFLSGMIQAGKLTQKKFFGAPVTATEFQDMIHKYVDIFNQDIQDGNLPGSIWDAAVQLANGKAVGKSLQIYKNMLEECEKGQEDYMPEEQLGRVHDDAKGQALEHFANARIFGGQQCFEECRKELQTQLDQTYKEICDRNKIAKEKFLGDVVKKAENEFGAKLEEAVPLMSASAVQKEMVFYPDAKIQADADLIKCQILEQFQQRLPPEENATVVNELLASLENSLKKIVEGHIKTNKLQRSNAEKFIEMLNSELVQRYKQDLNFKIDGNVVSVQDLEKFHDECKDFCLKEFREKGKPGNAEFQGGYLDKLIREMEKEYKNQKTANNLRLKEAAEQILQMINDKGVTYHASLEKFVEDHPLAEVEEITSFHTKSLENFLSEFKNFLSAAKSLGDDVQHETKLREKLEDIFEKKMLQIKGSRQEMELALGESMDKCLQNYFKKAAEVHEASENVAEFEKKHGEILKETLKEFQEETAKLGNAQTIEKFESTLKTKMMEKFTLLKTKSEQDRCVKTCLKEYESKVKTGFDSAHTVEEFQECHNNSKSQVTELFSKLWKDAKLEGEPSSKLRDILTKQLDDNFDKMKKHFELAKRREMHKESIVNALRNGVDFYVNEMTKYLENHRHACPRDVQREHQGMLQKAVDMAKREGGQDVTPDYIERMKKKMEKKLAYFQETCLKSFNDLKEPAIGIDLGTTNCCVMVYRKGEVCLIPNREQSSNLIPSYVGFHGAADGSEDTYGHLAKEQAFRFPEQTVYDAKRMIGRRWDDDNLQQDIKTWPFTVVNENQTPKIEIKGRRRYPHEVSAKLLTRIRMLAEDYLTMPRGSIRKAVITVPAYFLEPQRRATVQAAECAGLEVLNILNEPTAAAIAYNLQEKVTESRKALIYDLGGGTFDVAVVEITTDNINVLSVSGDGHLGGQDFDHLLMQYCIEEFKKTENGFDLSKGKDSTKKTERDDARCRMHRIKLQCEKAKERLSSAPSTTVDLDVIHENKRRIVEVTISLDKLNELVAPLIRKTEQIMEKCLEDAKEKGVRSKDDIDDVVLIGGSTRMKVVDEMLRKFFNGKQLSVHIHPDEAVAYGAAIQAAILNGKDALKHITVADVIPLSLGIESRIHGVYGRFSKILRKNDKIPFTNTQGYSTIDDNQTCLAVKVYQGESKVAKENNWLGEFDLNGLTPRPAGEEKMDVTMEINSLGILSVTGVITTTPGIKKSITIQAHRMEMDKATMDRVRKENDKLVMRPPQQA